MAHQDVSRAQAAESAELPDHVAPRRVVIVGGGFAGLFAARALRRTPDVVGGQAYFVTDDERLHGTAWFRPLVEGLGHRWPRARIPGRVAYALAWLGEQAYRFGGPEPVLTRIGVLKLDRSSALRVDRARRDLGYAPLWTRDTGLAAARDDHRALYEARRR